MHLIYRFDRPEGGKDVIPLTFCTNGTRQGWRWQAINKNRSLYGLELLGNAKHVVVTEGEKAADAGQRFLGRIPVVTWSGGSNAVAKTDWSPLTGRTVCIWPDNDTPGLKAALAVAVELEQISATVKIVMPPADVAEGWDLADAEQEGWTVEQVREALRGTLKVDSFKEATGLVAEPETDLSTLKTLQALERHFQTPQMFDQIETPEISASLLPGYLGEYADAVSRATQTPSGMAVMMALSVAATCLQKQFEVCPHGNDYREPVNLWTLTALPPASRKTAVISAMTAPITAWEKQRAKELEPLIRDIKIRRAATQKRIEKLMKKAADTDDAGEREKIITEITDTEATKPDEVRAPRLWTGDATPERLQMMLEEYDERMAVLTDEGGIFDVMAGLYNDGRANIDVFLQAHAGRSCRVDRQGRTACLDSPALTFGITVQPSVLEDLAGKKARFRGNGTLARFLFCMPHNNIGKRDVRKVESIPEAVKARYIAGISSLLEIEGKTRTLTLSTEAREYWLAFAQYVETNQGPGGDFESFQDWTGKLPGAALRIAGLLHIVEHGPSAPTIPGATMERTLDLCVMLIDHAKAAFELMGADQSTGDARAICEWLRREGLKQFSRNEVRRAFKGRWTTASRLDRALAELLGRDIIGKSEPRETAGRSAMVYPVNPLVFEKVGS